MYFKPPHNPLHPPKNPEPYNTKKALHLETLVLHLVGVSENQLACLLWTIKLCASVNTGSLFELRERWKLSEVDLMTPGVSGRMDHVLGPRKHGKFFWTRRKTAVCQHGFWCVRLHSHFCCYVETFNEKDVPSHLGIGVGEDTGIWCHPLCWEL